MRTLKNLDEPQLSGLDYWVSGANQYGYMRKRYFGEKSYVLGARAFVPVVGMTVGFQDYFRIICLVDNCSKLCPRDPNRI